MVKQIDMIQHLDVKMKLLICMCFSVAASPLAYVLDYYTGIIHENRNFIVLILSAFIIDVVFGMWKHLKLHTFSFSELLTKALTKIAVVVMAMVLFNAMAGVEGVGETGIKVYLLLIGKLMVMVYLSGSAFNNMYIITNGTFPPYSWMKRMKNFNESLDVNNLKSNPDASTEITK